MLEFFLHYRGFTTLQSIISYYPPMQERLDGNNYKFRGNNIEIIPMMQSRRCGLVERMVTEGVRKSVPVGDLVGVVSAVSGVSDDRNISNDGPADGTGKMNSGALNLN
ncbi:hypothetical protein QE152_g26972 [Popillia japonica]|uniref:Uncharacterized protein n=1 Tax=Popillia japonica TaxID=7064 RepID=A0AAW1JWU3_POPJA